MHAQCLGHQQLGPHAVGTGDQDGVLVAPHKREQTAEATKAAEDTRTVRRTRMWLDALYQRVCGVNIHACVSVGITLHGHPHWDARLTGRAWLGVGCDGTATSNGDSPHEECGLPGVQMHSA